MNDRSRNYYEILMVHHKAERIVIEAAFRRLARAYHPDVYSGNDAHERMVMINRAWEVLGDDQLRIEYDDFLTSVAAVGSKEDGSKRRSRSSKESPFHDATQPPAPVSSDYGISEEYYENAVRGAEEWRTRKKFIPKWMRIVLFLLLGGSGLVVTILAFWQQVRLLGPLSEMSCFGGPLLYQVLLETCENLYDHRRLNAVYIPKYNPNPEAYTRYANDLAEYETCVSQVYLSKTGKCFHTNQYCSGAFMTKTMVRYIAAAVGYEPCSRCGYTRVRARQLPSPFGRGQLSQ